MTNEGGLREKIAAELLDYCVASRRKKSVSISHELAANLIALISPAGEVSGWQPIETVPECVDVLVCVTHTLGSDEWQTLQWVDSYSGEYGWMHYPKRIDLPFRPSHWMPLPAAPRGMEG